MLPKNLIFVIGLMMCTLLHAVSCTRTHSHGGRPTILSSASKWEGVELKRNENVMVKIGDGITDIRKNDLLELVSICRSEDIHYGEVCSLRFAQGLDASIRLSLEDVGFYFNKLSVQQIQVAKAEPGVYKYWDVLLLADSEVIGEVKSGFESRRFNFSGRAIIVRIQDNGFNLEIKAVILTSFVDLKSRILWKETKAPQLGPKKLETLESVADGIREKTAITEGILSIEPMAGILLGYSGPFEIIEIAK